MWLKSGLLIIAFGVLIGGCATQTQQHAEKMQSELDVVMAKAAQCYDHARSMPASVKLDEKFALGEKATLKQLSDTTRPNESDKAIIAEYHTLVQPCRSGLIDGLMKSGPDWVPVYTEWFTRADEIYVELINEKITWGEANAASARLHAWKIAEEQHVSDKVNAELADRHRYELDQRRAGATAAYNAYQVNRPRYCTAIGSGFTCY